jgi:hypothetical protein
MPARAVNGKYGREPPADLVDGEAAHADALLPSARARLQLEVAPPHPERPREEAEELVIGGPTDGRRGHARAEGVAMDSGQSRA